MERAFDTDTKAERTRLLRACYSFLLPVARLLLRSGISYREFSDIAKVAYIQVASQDYGIRGRPTNASRVAAMTGVPRKDVRRVREISDDYMVDPRVQMSPLGDVLQQWCSRAGYVDAKAQPLPIPMSGVNSLETLARECAGDVPAGAIRVELLRIGAIEELSDGRLRIVRRELVPKDIDERVFTSLAFSLRALATTVAFNTDPNRKKPGRIERFVQSGPLAGDAKAALYHMVRARVTAFTEELDNLFSRYSSPSQEDGSRIGVGVYYHEDDAEAVDPSSSWGPLKD